MKVLAINSSPNMDKGATARILDPFLEGMKEEGADVEVLYTRKLEIKPCIADFQCWVKKPGECSIDDDMKKKVMPKVKSAEILVLATPVYVDGMTGPMKNLLDRLIALIQPFFVLRDAHCRHEPLEILHDSPKLVLVSSCGFWEMDNFEPLVSHCRAIGKNMSREFAGALLRPHAPAMRPMIEMGADISDVFESAKAAGRQLMRDGEMSEETLANISRPLLPLDDFVQQINAHFTEVVEFYKQKSAEN